MGGGGGGGGGEEEGRGGYLYLLFCQKISNTLSILSISLGEVFHNPLLEEVSGIFGVASDVLDQSGSFLRIQDLAVELTNLHVSCMGYHEIWGMGMGL